MLSLHLNLDNRFFLMLGQADMRENYTVKKIKFLMNMHVFYFKKYVCNM